jgi:hypothetical protein
MPPLRVIISKSLVVRGDDNDHSSNVFLSYGVKGCNFDCTPLFFLGLMLVLAQIHYRYEF